MDFASTAVDEESAPSPQGEKGGAPSSHPLSAVRGGTERRQLGPDRTWRLPGVAPRAVRLARSTLWYAGPSGAWPGEGAGRWTSPAWMCRAFQPPPELADADTIGVIYDETRRAQLYNKYGVLHELLAYPIPASGERYADVLRGHLRAERIGSMSLRRLATAHPQTVDAVSRKILGQPRFAWAEHGEALLRRRKSWYFGRDPVPASPCPVGASVSSSGRQTGKDRPDGVLSWEIMTSCGIPRPRMGPVRARH
jgi:hypothetical protein